ncbi:hypothetical protein WOC76_00055 [Methylocystis sp. IM3]|uniref:hypothetical protein n=1 Tax=unclassified Methylocystis TaxID=2625913 RepID=UPI0030FBF22A
MKLNALLHAIGLSIARYLTTEVEAHPLTAPESIERLHDFCDQGDVVLVEGRSRIS